MLGGELPTSANQWAKLTARKRPVWRESRPRDRFPRHGFATTAPKIRPSDTGRQRQSKMNRNATGPVGQAQRVNQADGKCIRHPRTSSDSCRNGVCLTHRLATIRFTTVGTAVGRLRQPAPNPVMKGQPARPFRRPATCPTHGKHALFTEHGVTIRTIRRQCSPMGATSASRTREESCRNDGATNRPLRIKGTSVGSDLSALPDAPVEISPNLRTALACLGRRDRCSLEFRKLTTGPATRKPRFLRATVSWKSGGERVS
jgi:hypothetical protein